MRELYHCMYRQPEGEAILATCFRAVNGIEKNYVFAATHLTKALAFAFSYHDGEVLFNSGIEDAPSEIVMLCGGQATLDKPRSITVFGFPDEGFTEIPGARQAVSESPVPFSQARIVMKTTDINDLMARGLQIFVLPHDVSYYADPQNADNIWSTYMTPAPNFGQGVAGIMAGTGARWINRERGTGVCPLLREQMGLPMEDRVPDDGLRLSVPFS